MLAGECPRKTWWEKTVPYEQKPSRMQASVKGTAQHAHFEKFNEEDILAEVRLVYIMPSGRVITGQIDRFLPEHARIEDYKFKQEDKEPFTSAPANYVMQLNIYRMMLTKGCIIQETGEIIQPQEVNELVLFPSNHKDWFEVYCPIWPIDMVEKYVETLLDLFDKAQEETPPRGYEDPQTNPFCRNWCPFHKQCVATGGEHREIYVEVLVGAA